MDVRVGRLERAVVNQTGGSTSEDGLLGTMPVRQELWSIKSIGPRLFGTLLM